MISYLENKEIDYAKWDFSLSESSNRLVYANSWYLDLVCDAWDALVLNDYEAVMPLPKRKKWGIQYVYQPFFCQQLGIFSNQSGLDVDVFLEAIPKHFKYVELNLNSGNTTSKHCVKENVNYLLSLKPIDELSKGFSENTKRNIKKSGKQDLTIKELGDYRDTEVFLKDFGKLPVNTTEEYKLFSREALEKKCFKNYGVFLADDLLASAFVVETSDRVTYLNGVVAPEGKRNGAMHYLFEYLFKLYLGKIFDFEGSNIEGIARFYKGFGAREVAYQTVKINRLPFFLRWLKS